MSPYAASIYVDASAGIAGDMLLAALLDLGVELADVEKSLRPSLPPFDLKVHTARTSGLAVKRLDVVSREDSPPRRTLGDIEALITAGAFAKPVKETALRVFRSLGEAEAAVHGVGLQEIHFHEVGALDSLVDVLGSIVAVHELAPKSFSCSSLPLGSGSVQTEHGLFPVPAPATLELLKGVPTHPLDVNREVSTPTGVALAKGLADRFGPPPAGQIEAIGYGAGTRDAGPSERPNVLRAWSYSATTQESGPQRVTILESNVDHLTGEDAGHLVETLLGLGARDAFLIGTIQKKSRPGLLATVICDDAHADALEHQLFLHSGTLGVRRRTSERRALERTFETVELHGATISIKCAYLEGRRVSAHPEFEDLRKLSSTLGTPVRELRHQAIAQLGPHK